MPTFVCVNTHFCVKLAILWRFCKIRVCLKMGNLAHLKDSFNQQKKDSFNQQKKDNFN